MPAVCAVGQNPGPRLRRLGRSTPVRGAVRPWHERWAGVNRLRRLNITRGCAKCRQSPTQLAWCPHRSGLRPARPSGSHNQRYVSRPSPATATSASRTLLNGLISALALSRQCVWFSQALRCARWCVVPPPTQRVAARGAITLLTPDKTQHRIRIAGIDAPEKAQPFGNRSKQNMERMAHGQEALADCPKTDRYGRKLCKVYVQPQDCPTCGKTLDVGLAQVSAGLAWWYRAYHRRGVLIWHPGLPLDAP